MDFDLFISSLLDEKESYDLEYKSAEGGFPGSFWDTYSSFGDDIEHIGYNKLLTLSTCLAENVITNDRLKDLLTLHRTDITKLLKELCNDNLLISVRNRQRNKILHKRKG